MLIIPPTQYRGPNRSKGKKANAPPPAPNVLTLVSASYDNVALTLTLSFDRAIDISGYDGSGIVPDDGTFNTSSYTPINGPVLVDPKTVQIGLAYLYGDHDPGVFLTAQAGSGIVAVDDGGTWAGCSELSLPFG